jgi:hypothetical protein
MRNDSIDRTIEPALAAGKDWETILHLSARR